jgi:maltose/moltooligosaccharide transporter
VVGGPLTGLVIQPIIGNLSDNTWGPLGRRRPYFLVGALLSTIALIWMPNAGSLWMAVGLLWLLDTAANISMEPFRAFVGDLLPPRQRTQGFAMQSLFIGLGAVLASAMPWILTHWLGLATVDSNPHTISLSVKVSFYVGAAVFLGTVLWTVLLTEERPPRDMEAFREQQARRLGVWATVREVGTAFRDMPSTMRQLAWVQGFSWLGMYCVFLYFPPAIAHNLFGAVDEASARYAEGVEWAGICMAAYNAVCFVVSFALPRLAAVTNRQVAHALCLTCGGGGPDFPAVGALSPLGAVTHGGAGHRLVQPVIHALCHAGECPSPPQRGHLHGHFQHVHCAAGDRGFPWGWVGS